MLKELTDRAEKVKAKILTVAEDAIADHQATPLADHFAAYKAHQEGKGVSSRRVSEVQRQLRRVAEDCAFRRLADLDYSMLERWLNDRKAENMGAATRNEYRGAFVGFANWCVRSKRLLSNPFDDVPVADVKIDRRRQRRAMTESELVKLLEVASKRPTLDAMTVRRGKDKGKLIAKLREETRERLALLGRERALIYKTMVLTGLRKAELASITIGQVHLADSMPYLELAAADEKNREGSHIPLRGDLAADLGNGSPTSRKPLEGVCKLPNCWFETFEHESDHGDVDHGFA